MTNAAAVISVVRGGNDILNNFCVETQKVYCERFRYELIILHPETHPNETLEKIVSPYSDILIIDNSTEIKSHTPRFDKIYNKKSNFIALSDFNTIKSSPIFVVHKHKDIVNNILGMLYSPYLLNSFSRNLANNLSSEVVSSTSSSHTAMKLPDNWGSHDPEKYDDTFLFRFIGTGLQAAKRSAPQLSSYFSARTGNEAQNRLRCISHQSGRQLLLQKLQTDNSTLNYFKKLVLSVSKSKKILLPRLIKDNAQSWLWRHEYLLDLIEPATIELIRRFARRAEWAVDGGAHIGYVTRQMISANPACRIIAIEAHPENAETLRLNLGRTTVKVINAALSNSTDTVTLFDGNGHSNSSLSKQAASGTRSFSIKSKTISDLLLDTSPKSPGLIKLDIEGYEMEAMIGAKSIISSNKNIAIFLEMNPRILKIRHIKLRDIYLYLSEYGYTGRRIMENYRLGVPGLTDNINTSNYLFLHQENWKRYRNELP